MPHRHRSQADDPEDSRGDSREPRESRHKRPDRDYKDKSHKSRKSKSKRLDDTEMPEGEGSSSRPHRSHRHRVEAVSTPSPSSAPRSKEKEKEREREERRARRRRRVWLARWIADRWLYKSRHRLANLRAENIAKYTMMKTVFIEWHQVAWDARHGWKKEVTADVHCKVMLLRRCFKGWRKFMDLQHKEHEKERELEAIADKHVLKVAWGQWQVFMDHCRAEQAKEMDRVAVAMQFWSGSTERKYLVAWKRYVLHRRARRRQINIADDWNNQNIVWKTWNVWLKRVKEHKQSRLKVIDADLFSAVKLKKMVWSRWSRYVDCRLDEKDNVCTVEQSVMRHVLHRWLKHLRVVEKLRLFVGYAAEHDENRRKKLVFIALKAAVERRKRKNNLLSLAFTHSNDVLLQTAFGQWKNGVEEIKAEKEAKSMMMAESHRNRAMKASHLHAWSAYCKYVKQRRVKLAAGLARHSTVIVHVSFTKLAQYARRRRQYKDDYEKADALSHRQLLIRSCNMWRAWTGLRQREHTIAVVADRVLLRGMLDKWRRRRERDVDHRNRVLTAEEEGQHRFLMFYMRRWKAFTSYKLLREEHRRVARQFDYIRTIGTCFQSWIEFTDERVQRRVEAASARTALLRSFMGRVLQFWRARTWEVMSDRVRKDRADIYFDSRLIMQSWAAWRAYVSVKQDEDMQRQRAVSYHRLVLLSKSLVTWQTATAQALAQKEAEYERVMQARVVIRRGRRRRAFEYWLEYSRRKFLGRVSEARAVVHHRSNIMLKAVLAWYKYALYRKYKAALAGKAIIMNRRLIATHAFGVWRSEYNDRVVYHYQSWTAVRFWARMRLKTAFRGWTRYHQHWMDKRAEVRTAMAAHDRFLRSEGLAGLIAGASNARSRRLAAAQKVAASDVKRIWRVVERIARHWRRKTLDSKNKREMALMDSRNAKVSLGRVATFEINGAPTVFTRYVEHARPAPIDAHDEQENRATATTTTNTMTTASTSRYSKYIPPPRMRPAPRRPALLDPTLETVIDKYGELGGEGEGVNDNDQENQYVSVNVNMSAIPAARKGKIEEKEKEVRPSVDVDVVRLGSILKQQEAIVESHNMRQNERDALQTLLATLDSEDAQEDIESRIKQLDDYALEYERTRDNRMAIIRDVAAQLQALKVEL